MRVCPLLLALGSALLPLAAQDFLPSPQNDLIAVYRPFFAEVVSRKNDEGPVWMNGAQGEFRRPSVQEALGWTRPETEALIAVATDCLARLKPLNEQLRSVTFTVRLQNMQGGPVSQAVQRRRSSIEEQRLHVMEDAMRKLKNELGDARVNEMTRYIEGRRSQHSFFPDVPLVTLPARPTPPAQ